MRRLYTPPSAKRSSCQRSRCASSFSPLHHHIGTGEKLRGGSSKRLSRSVSMTCPSQMYRYGCFVVPSWSLSGDNLAGHPIGINLTKGAGYRVGAGAPVERGWGPCGRPLLPLACSPPYSFAIPYPYARLRMFSLFFSLRLMRSRCPQGASLLYERVSLRRRRIVVMPLAGILRWGNA